MRKHLLLIALLPACYHNPQGTITNELLPVHLSAAPATDSERSLPLAYWTEQRMGSDTLALSILRIDLQQRALSVQSVIAPDPDATGPAEAALTDPLQLAQNSHVLAAVNANAFAGMPDSTGKRDSNWHETQPVDIQGYAVHAGTKRSVYDNTSVADAVAGISSSGAAYVGPASSSPALVEAVHGWSFPTIVVDGKPVPAVGGPRHPRTAIGVDKSGRWLYLVVIDGRQAGYSNGVTGRELANEMIRIGADRAINVDGGGSSIMLVAQSDGTLATINRPSGGSRRPVPVMFGVARRSN